MPGNVATATPSVVMPFALCAAYEEDRAYTRMMNLYPDGSSDRSARESTSRKRFALTARLRNVDMTNLLAFALARKGQPFWFYLLRESNYTVDLTGANTLGRYAVRFDGPIQLTTRAGARWDLSLSLVEVA